MDVKIDNTNNISPNLSNNPEIKNPLSDSTNFPPQQNNAGESSNLSNNIVVEKKKRSVFDILIFISLIIAFFVWSGVIFLYIQNRSIGKKTEVPTPTITSQVTPTITTKIYNISTKNGNIINSSENKEEVIIDKSDYKGAGITGFTQVVTSQKKDKLCFESWPPSIDPAIFISDINGDNVEEISKYKKNCIWSQNGKMVAYNNITTTKSKSTDIYYYDLETKIEKNLTTDLISTQSASLNNYKIISWSDNDNKILCEYSPISDSSDINSCEISIPQDNLDEI